MATSVADTNVPINPDGTFDMSAYLWLVPVSAFCALGAAYGIGANDVANAFATSVGAKSLTLKQAVACAAVFEFGGAVLLGSKVTGTIRGSIADLECFTDRPATLMYGMQCVIFVVGIWLVLASKFSLPVSTTHSTVGGVVGFALVSGGGGCVKWAEKSDEFPYVEGMGAIFMSWLISPVLSGIAAAIIFFLVRTFVLRAENSYGRSFWVYPILVLGTFLINIFFIIYKGAAGLGLDDTPLSTAMAVSFGISIGLAILSIFFLKPMKKRIDKEFENGDKVWGTNMKGISNDNVETGVSVIAAPAYTGKASVTDPATATAGALVDGVAQDDVTKPKGGFGRFDHDMHRSMKTDSSVSAVHDNAEKFDSRSERVFTYLQVFTACFDSFGHGANDVANSIAPFATVYIIYTTGVVSKDSDLGSNAYWVLALGGFGIVLGLATYGYHIIEAIGVKLTRVTPSRGFSIELGAAIIIIIGSRYGIPLSTTHCQVGATTGVGLLEGGKGVNWLLFLRIVAGWVATLVVVGGSVALIFAQGLYAPSN